MAPFSCSMMEEYVEKYVASSSQQLEAPPLSQSPPAWSVQQYMMALTDIPNFMELVKNPFILSVILRLLSDIAGSPYDVALAKVSFDELYKHISNHWMGIGKQRLRGKMVSSAEQQALGILMEGSFRTHRMEFLKDLAGDIFERQGGDPVTITLALV
ncbi:hypothetical protein BGZ88_000172 [Linnemannia elongata]|nr:hypothetical protein BGZ88_000172 [Linnemannia elongata]